MVRRQFWLDAIEARWRRRRVLWLSGVRRAGKTFLARTLDDVEYFDCELPRVRQRLSDVEGFLDDMRGRRVVLDEIHRLDDPAGLLKVAADHYDDVHVLATGSSTLGASSRFRDTLAGRKLELWLTPMIGDDRRDFGELPLDRRLLHGGLPPFYLADALPERDFQEWMDAFWAKDVLELFRLERRSSFLRFAELLLAQSGAMFEATRFARPCEVSRTTIANYLAVLEASFVAHVIRPFSSRRQQEIVSAPKVYGFDTGFVCAFRGWSLLRPEDRGLLWEHLVLNEMHARLQTRDIRYWRDKRGHEIDFVVVRRGAPPVAVECKWSASGLDWTNLRAFAAAYPKATAIVVAQDAKGTSTRRDGALAVRVIGLSSLERELGLPPRNSPRSE
jgi:predicted AAA+ superfamily ATPase